MHSSPSTLLIVHRDPHEAKALQHSLEKKGYKTLRAEVSSAEQQAGQNLGEVALKLVYQHLPDLIVADLALPGMNGYQLCRLLKNDPVTQQLPVLLIAPTRHKTDAFWSFKAGADSVLSQDELPVKLLPEINMLLGMYDRISPEERRLLQQHIAHEQTRNKNLPQGQQQQQGLYNTKARLAQLLDKTLIEATLMSEFRTLSDLVHDKSLLNHMLFSLLESLIEYDLLAVVYHDPTREPLQVTFHVPEERAVNPETLEALKQKLYDDLQQQNGFSRELSELETVVIGKTTDSSEKPSEKLSEKPLNLNDLQTHYVQKFFGEPQLIGTLALYHRGKVHYPDLFPLKLLERELHLLMKLRYLYARAEVVALQDSVTGLYNYRHFTETLEREFRRSRRYELAMTVALISIDQFEQFNEQGGYLLGDEVLRHVAQVAHRMFRNTDFVARVGSKELAVLFAETPLERAQIPCERFQKQLTQESLAWQAVHLTPTVSVGLTQIGPDTESPSALMKALKDRLRASRQQANQLLGPSAL